MPTKNLESESDESPTRQDIADSTREIIERVDSQTEGVRADLADRTETVREQVVDSTATAKTVLADKTEATRADLAERTEAVRVDLAARTDTIRQQVVDATHQAKREVEDKTEATRASMEYKYDARKAIVDHQFNSYRSWFVFAVIVFSLTNTFLYYLFLNPRTPSSLLEISEIRVTGPVDLCPGEYLDYSFDMVVKEAGVYGLDISVFRTSPLPMIAVFSESQFFVIGSPRTFPVTRHWQIPERYEDKVTKENIEFIPGDYERSIAVGTTSSSTHPSTETLKFSIRDGCEE